MKKTDKAERARLIVSGAVRITRTLDQLPKWDAKAQAGGPSHSSYGDKCPRYMLPDHHPDYRPYKASIPKRTADTDYPGAKPFRWDAVGRSPFHLAGAARAKGMEALATSTLSRLADHEGYTGPEWADIEQAQAA